MSSALDPVVIRPFCTADQAAARRLILEGMREHWGHIDPHRNPDLDEIAAYYADGDFVVAQWGEQLVGTGALIAEDECQGRIVRMSVAPHCRRLGIGTRILKNLCNRAIAAGYESVVLETTSSWADAIGFYAAMGFGVTHYEEDETHFVLGLDASVT